MKTSNWIKLIGILCIVFGSLGIIENISSFFTPQWVKDTWPEISTDRLKWMELLAYFGFFVNTIYLMAGVFFLQRKPISLNLMYGALTISILFVVIPLLLVKPYDLLLFVLIGPFIDLALLIGVYRIRKYYYESPNEVVKPFGEITLTSPLLKLLSFAGLICISIPVLILGLWIHAFNSGTNQLERVAIFNGYFPGFLSGRNTIYLSLAFCILAIILSSICLKLSRKLWKTLNITILIIGFLLLLLNLFQLM